MNNSRHANHRTFIEIFEKDVGSYHKPGRNTTVIDTKITMVFSLEMLIPATEISFLS